MNRFRSEHILLRRAKGSYDENGIWIPPERHETTFLASIQPVSNRDMDQMETFTGGRRFSRSIRVYTDEKLKVSDIANHEDDASSGDIVVYEGENYLIVGEARHNIVKTRVSHNKYMAVRQIEVAHTGENVL